MGAFGELVPWPGAALADPSPHRYSEASPEAGLYPVGKVCGSRIVGWAANEGLTDRRLGSPAPARRRHGARGPGPQSGRSPGPADGPYRSPGQRDVQMLPQGIRSVSPQGGDQFIKMTTDQSPHRELAVLVAQGPLTSDAIAHGPHFHARPGHPLARRVHHPATACSCWPVLFMLARDRLAKLRPAESPKGSHWLPTLRSFFLSTHSTRRPPSPR